MSIPTIHSYLRLTIIILFTLLLSFSTNVLADFYLEIEPNNNPGDSNYLGIGTSGRGAISYNTDKDFWDMWGYETGDQIFVLVDTSSSSASKDSYLKIYGSSGLGVLEEDDSSGPGFGSAIAGFSVPDSSVYFSVEEDNSDNTISSYKLLQVFVKPDQIAPEVEGNDTPSTAMPVTHPAYLGTLDDLTDVDYYSFYAQAGDQMALIVNDDPDNDGILTDTEIDLLDTDGTTVLSVGDDSMFNKANSTYIVTAPSTGVYYARVREDGSLSPDNEYTLVVVAKEWVFPRGACCDGVFCEQRHSDTCWTTYGGDSTKCEDDADSDTVSDYCDNCPVLANTSQEDDDKDNVGNSCDFCPTDPSKVNAGACGCNKPDIDVNLDGQLDCGKTIADMLAGPGVLLIPESTNDRVMAFDPNTGNLIDAAFIDADSTLSTPRMAILGPDNNSIIVSDSVKDVLFQFTLDGTLIKTFAPIGGKDNSIMDYPSCMTYNPQNGNLLVANRNGSNGDSVLEFDADGNYIGHFITPSAGGLDGPYDLTFSGNYVYVTGYTSDAIHKYDAVTRTPVTSFPIDSAPEQIIVAANGNLLVANLNGTLEGVVEIQQDGVNVATYAPSDTSGFRGVYELPNGNMLVTSSQGVFEINRGGTMVATKISDVSARFIEFAIIDADNDGVGDAIDICNGDDKIDNDSDGTPDACDACANDGSKTAPGTCGCGVADSDANGNGVLDCLVSQELSELNTRLRGLVKKLKALKSKAGKKKKEAQKQLKADIKALRSEIVALVASAGTQVVLTEGAPSVDSLAKKVKKAVGKALKTKSAKFKKNKKAAMKALKKFIGFITA